jgi:hypothetical protein
MSDSGKQVLGNKDLVLEDCGLAYPPLATQSPRGIYNGATRRSKQRLLAAVTEGMGRLFERVFNYSPISAILDEELVLQTIMLFNDRVY